MRVNDYFTTEPPGEIAIIGDCILIHGDCLDVLPCVKEGVIDAVVTDPPYAIPAVHYVGKRGEKQPRRNLGELSIVEHWFRSVAEYIPSNAAMYIFCDGQSYPVFLGHAMTNGNLYAH